MTGIVNVNGELFDPSEAKISVFDRGFLFGDSVYEVALSYDGAFLFLDEHISRLQNSADLLGIKISYTASELKKEVLRTYHASDLGKQSAYIRIVLTRGEGEISLDSDNTEKNNMVIIVKPNDRTPAWCYEKGVSIIVSTVVKNDPKALNPNAKSGNYLNNVLVYREARRKGAFDAVMVNQSGMVTEATTSNIWIVKDGIVFTPKLDSGILKGITRTFILKLAQDNDIKIVEKNFLVDELYSADECFLTSSTKEVMPVTTIDEQKVGSGNPGTITKKLIQLFKECIENYIEENI